MTTPPTADFLLSRQDFANNFGLLADCIATLPDTAASEATLPLIHLESYGLLYRVHYVLLTGADIDTLTINLVRACGMPTLESEATAEHNLFQLLTSRSKTSDQEPYCLETMTLYGSEEMDMTQLAADGLDEEMTDTGLLLSAENRRGAVHEAAVLAAFIQHAEQQLGLQPEDRSIKTPEMETLITILAGNMEGLRAAAWRHQRRIEQSRAAMLEAAQPAPTQDTTAEKDNVTPLRPKAGNKIVSLDSFRKK